MHLSQRLTGLILVACSIILAACSALLPTPAPTQDSQKVLTDVAKTVNVELTRSSASTPSITPTPPPSATPPLPTLTQTLAPSVTPPTATITTSPTRAAGPNKAELVKQSIPDRSKFNPGALFSVTWTFKNIGQTTWTAEFSARYWSDDRMDSPDINKFGKDVKPGESIDLTINFKAPTDLGVHKSTWWLQGDDGVNFYPFFIEIEVVNIPPTSTTTATVAPATATTTPTITPTP
jgi:Ig-like domain from next to BRCA1 gene